MNARGRVRGDSDSFRVAVLGVRTIGGQVTHAFDNGRHAKPITHVETHRVDDGKAIRRRRADKDRDHVVHMAVTVVVLAVATGLHREAVRVRIGVITVAVAEGNTVTVQVESLVDLGIAVVVEEITDFRRTGIDRRVSVVAIGGRTGRAGGITRESNSIPIHVQAATGSGPVQEYRNVVCEPVGRSHIRGAIVVEITNTNIGGRVADPRENALLERAVIPAGKPR